MRDVIVVFLPSVVAVVFGSSVVVGVFVVVIVGSSHASFPPLSSFVVGSSHL